MKTCTRCGQENLDESTFCGRCGVSLAEVAPPGPAPPAQPPGAQPPYPQYAPPYPQYAPPPYPQYVRRPKETKLAVAGGVLVLVGGVLALISSFLGLILFSLFYGDYYYGGIYYYPYSFGVFQVICGVVGLAFAIIAIVGGYFAIKRRNFAMAVVGAVFCMLSVGSMGISSILGLVGLILIAVSGHEFR